MPRTSRLFWITPLCLVIVAGPLHAQGSPDGLLNGSIFGFPAITSDGTGGAIVAWNAPSGALAALGRAPEGGVPIDGGVVAARIYPNSGVAWVSNSLNLSTTVSEIAIAPDGAGGAIVTWADRRSGTSFDVYAHHVLSSGQVDGNWPAQGRALCTASGDQSALDIATDGAGGAIVTWQDPRNGVSHIYGEHVTSGGAADPAWPVNGRALCTAAGGQTHPRIVSDTAGGAIVTWTDARSGTSDVYAQRVLANGSLSAAWLADGAALCSAAGEQTNPVIVADSGGGAIVAWSDTRLAGNADIYAVRVSPTGAIVSGWPANGRALCAAADQQTDAAIVADGSGGAVVTWRDARNGGTSYSELFAQRVSAGGAVNPSWPADGRSLGSGIQAHGTPQIVTDGAGGGIVVWQEFRNSGEDVYTHHVGANGILDVMWPTDGRAVCLAPGTQSGIVAVSNGAGGVITAWQDKRNATHDDLYVERVTVCGEASGVARCRTDGVGVCQARGNVSEPTITSDGGSGAIIAWSDGRLDLDANIYVQHVGASAVDATWPAGGRALCTAPMDQTNPQIVSDGAGGAIVVWLDNRSDEGIDLYAQRVLASGAVAGGWPADGRLVHLAVGADALPVICSDNAGGAIVAFRNFVGAQYDIYAQRIGPSGTLLWAGNGVVVCASTGDHTAPAITADGSGGAIVTWKDHRGSNYDIYAQRVNAAGGLQWSPADGVVVCNYNGEHDAPALVSDDAGGTIVTWKDHRGANYDIYARRLSSAGVGMWMALGNPVCTASGEHVTPVIAREGPAERSSCGVTGATARATTCTGSTCSATETSRERGRSTGPQCALLSDFRSCR